MLVEIVLSFGPSTALVEAGFSHLTYMLNDQRLHMSHETLKDLLVLKVNQYAWSSDDVNEIIQNALKEFMSAKRRKLKLEDRSFAMVTKARQNCGEVETYPVVEPPDEDDLFDENEDDEPLPESVVEDLFSKLQFKQMVKVTAIGTTITIIIIRHHLSTSCRHHPISAMVEGLLLLAECQYGFKSY